MKSRAELRLAELLFADPVALGGSGDGTPIRPRRLEAWLEMVTGHAVQVARGELPATDGHLVVLPAALPRPIEESDAAIWRCAGLVQAGLSALGLLDHRPFLARMHRDWVLRTCWSNLAGNAVLNHYGSQMPGIARDILLSRASAKAMRLMVNVSEVPRAGLPPLFSELLAEPAGAAEALGLMGRASSWRERIHRADLGPPPVPWLLGVLRPEWLLDPGELDEDWKKGQKPLRMLRRAMDKARRKPKRPESAPRPADTVRRPEWAGGWQADAVEVVESEARGGPLSSWDRILAAHRREARSLQRRFAALREEPRWRGGQLDGSEVDLDRALIAMADISAGQEPDRRLYRRFVRPPLPLAVHVLVDLSASTTGAVLHAQQQAVVLLALALQSIGLPCAFTGFNGEGRVVRLHRLKDFDEPLDEPARKRLANLVASGNTRLGTVLRHAGEGLKKRPEPQRLLLLLSDGRPEGRDYRGQDALTDSALAVREVSRAGIEVQCVSLDPRDTRWLEPIFGRRHLVLKRVEELPHRLPALVASRLR